MCPNRSALLLEKESGKIMMISPDGMVEWERCAWESIRSDTHQICLRINSRLEIQGSPARVGFRNNAFGSLDIHYCAEKMITFALSIRDFRVRFAVIVRVGMHPHRHYPQSVHGKQGRACASAGSAEISAFRPSEGIL